MQGHLRRRGKTWCVVIELPRGADGKRKQRWITVHGTKRDAERERARIVNEINTGAYVEPSRMTLAEYLERWLRDYGEGSLSPASLDTYRTLIRRHIVPGLGALPLSRLQPLHIQAFYTELREPGARNGAGPLAPASQRLIHHVLHRALGQAVRWQLLARNPADAVEPPRVDKANPLALSLPQMEVLLAALADTWLFVPALLSMATGFRRGEVLGLRWEDVDEERGSLALRASLTRAPGGVRLGPTKTGQSHQVPLPRVLMEVLATHRAAQDEVRRQLGAVYVDRGFVFARADGSPVRPGTLTSAFTALVEATPGLPQITFHGLRHSHATLMLLLKIHPKVVSERLGHSSVDITMDLYSHVIPSIQREAADATDAPLRAILPKRKP